MATEKKVTIILDKAGAVKVGDYLPGKQYQVDAGEAERLISTKGFKAVTDSGEA